jgi:stress-induced morphogen
MAMEASIIETMIRESIPDAIVTLNDTVGDGDHWSALVISKEFKGLSRIKQHQLVYKSLKGFVGGELHALALQTSTPE